MWRVALALPLLIWLPGFLLFRLPHGNRALRAALPTEERLFWAVMLSAATSSVTALALAGAGAYSLDRVLLSNLAICLLLAVVARGHLRLGPDAVRVTRTAAAPAVLLLLAAGIFFFVPPAEYINGGRDPALYIVEGIQLSREGSFFSDDPLVRDLPPESRGLFFTPLRDAARTEDLRFLGYFIADMDRGIVVGQFPHFYPVWAAMAYELNGLTGARYVHGIWAIGGVLAIYFLGAALFGRRAAFAAAGLLTLNVAQVWFARYFISEPFQQALIFTSLLAFVRSQDTQPAFAPIAGLLAGLTVFANLSNAIGMATLAAAAIVGRVMGGRLRASFLLSLFGMGAAAIVYYVTVLPHYAFSGPVTIAMGRQLGLFFGLTVTGLCAGILIVRYAGARIARLANRWLPPLTLGIILILGIYALFLSGSTQRLDPSTPRTGRHRHLHPLLLAAARPRRGVCRLGDCLRGTVPPRAAFPCGHGWGTRSSISMTRTSRPITSGRRGVMSPSSFPPRCCWPAPPPSCRSATAGGGGWRGAPRRGRMHCAPPRAAWCCLCWPCSTAPPCARSSATLNTPA